MRAAPDALGLGRGHGRGTRALRRRVRPETREVVCCVGPPSLSGRSMIRTHGGGVVTAAGRSSQRPPQPVDGLHGANQFGISTREALSGVDEGQPASGVTRIRWHPVTSPGLAWQALLAIFRQWCCDRWSLPQTSSPLVEAARSEPGQCVNSLMAAGRQQSALTPAAGSTRWGTARARRSRSLLTRRRGASHMAPAPSVSIIRGRRWRHQDLATARRGRRSTTV